MNVRIDEWKENGWEDGCMGGWVDGCDGSTNEWKDE